MKDTDDILPKKNKYIIGKEVLAVSIQDAIRKERSAVITEIRVIEEDTE